VIRHADAVIPKLLRAYGGIDEEPGGERRVFGGKNSEKFQDCLSLLIGVT
jgi:hypothetical protein